MDRELRQLQHDVKHGLVQGDAQLGGLPIGGADGKPVPGAYAVNNAIEHVCPLCGADGVPGLHEQGFRGGAENALPAEIDDRS